MVSSETVHQLQQLIENRQIGLGSALLDQHRSGFAAVHPDEPGAGSAVGCLAQWLDVGYEDGGLLAELLGRFRYPFRQHLALTEYVPLRLAEGLHAMRNEELNDALRHLDSALSLSKELEDPRAGATAIFWKARCLRKA